MPLTIFEQAHHVAGDYPNPGPDIIEFDPPALVLDILVYGQDLMIAFSSDAIHWTTPRYWPAGLFGSLNLLVKKISVGEVPNPPTAPVAKGALAPAKKPGPLSPAGGSGYDITAYYNPIEVTGVPYTETTVA